MRRLAQDLLLIVAPFATLSLAFFLGDQPRFGIAFVIVTLAALWYVRPHLQPADGDPADEDVPPPQRMPGAGGAGAGAG